MERYDGRTRKDDFRKYILIALAVLVLLSIWLLVLHFFTKDPPEPDYRVVYGAEATLDEDTAAYLEEYIGDVVGDLNGDGEVVVDLACVPVDPWEMENATSGFMYLGVLLSEPDVNLFLLTDEPIEALEFKGLSNNYCGQKGFFMDLPEDMADEEFPNRVNLNDSALFQYLGYGDGPLLYGSVCITDDDEAQQLALEILNEIYYGSVRVIAPKN